MAKKRTAWAHLPNAGLIDAVIADVKARPGVWVAALAATPHTELDVAYFAALAPEDDEMLDAVYGAAYATARGAARGAAWHVLLALVAWDDCAHLLDLPSTTLRTMINLCDAPVCHQAVLLLPYVLVKEAGQ